MVNPDFHMTLYISDEIIRMGCLTIGFALSMWALVRMTDILFGKAPDTTTTLKETND
jgi:hypothetical protein